MKFTNSEYRLLTISAFLSSTALGIFSDLENIQGVDQIALSSKR